MYNPRESDVCLRDILAVSDLRNKMLQLKHRVLSHPVYKVISYIHVVWQRSKLFQIRGAGQASIGLVDFKRTEIHAVVPVQT
jgi:hypothetical protein